LDAGLGLDAGRAKRRLAARAAMRMAVLMSAAVL